MDLWELVVPIALILLPLCLLAAGVVANLWHCYFWLHKNCHYSLDEIKWRKAFYPNDTYYCCPSGFASLSWAYAILSAYIFAGICFGIAYMIKN